MIGKQVGHYRILEKLGEGGMGVVYKAEDTDLDRLVALKFLPPHLGEDAEERKRFIHEAKAASALDHTNICTVHEIGQTAEGRLFIAMGYCAGQTLREKIKEGSLPVDEAVGIAVQIAEGLKKAHGKGIVHRDLKPANVMLTDEGVVKIVDFGLAKLRGVSRLTKTGTTLGTVSYMSPEQTTGREVDQRTDIWSLGVILYEMLTGKLPFSGDYDQAMIYSILNEEPESPSTSRPKIAAKLERTVLKALAKDKAGRYANMGEFIQDAQRSMEISDSEPFGGKSSAGELATGTTFARRYKVIEELGHGGMGRVYKVFDTEIKEKIALKLLKPEIASDPDTLERFANELKLARKVSHRNICRMFDMGRAEGFPFITMEWVAGEDLKRLLRRVGALSAGKAVAIARQICAGMAEAHGQGVIHRDLKPQNIMIDEEGNVRVMDFGIARMAKVKGITGVGVIIGTPEYMSPEQVDGEEADQSSDIYALGIILFEMLTGRVPFEGNTPFSVALKQKSEAPPNPRTVTPQIPEDLSNLILRCLEKQRSRRYQSAADVLVELDKIEKGIPTTDRILPRRKPITSREITVKFNLRKLYLPGLVLIALAIAAVIVTRLFPRKTLAPGQAEKPSLAVIYFENNTGDKNLDYWRKALSDLLITDLMQSRYIKVSSAESLYDILKGLNLLEAGPYSRDDLRRIAVRSGVENILVGKYARAGDIFRIDAVLQKASTGEPVGPPQRVQGKGQESFFSLVDELTKNIKTSLKLTPEEIASDNDKEVGKITTSSPEAYKFYSEGRKYHLMGDDTQSISLMEKALAIDPDFAMAYRSIAISYGDLGLSSERARCLQKAFELRSRSSERERYIIEGDYYLQSEKTYDKAIDVYNKLLERYPDDRLGLSKLAWLYGDLEQRDKVIEICEAAIKYGAEDIYTYEYLATAYEDEGLFDKAVELLQGYLKNISDNLDIRLELSDAYFYQKKFDAALAEVEKAYTLDPTNSSYFLYKGAIYLYQGDLFKAEGTVSKTPEPQGGGRSNGLFVEDAVFVFPSGEVCPGKKPGLSRNWREFERCGEMG